MPGIDTSMYATPQQPNMLQQFGQLQSLDNAMQQNKLMQQEQQQRGIQIDMSKAALYETQLGLEGEALAQVYGAHGGNPTRGHVIDAVLNLMTNRPDIFNKSYAVKGVLHDMPSDQELAENPNALKSWIISKASMVDKAREAIKPFLPNVQFQNVGDKLQPVDVNPQSNPNLASQSLPMGFTPGEASAPDTIGYGPQGQPISGTHAAATMLRQGGNPVPGALPPQGAVPGQNLGITAPAPGTAEASSALAGVSAGQAADLQKHAEAYQQSQGTLRNLNDLKEKFSTGPFAGLLGKIRGGAIQINNAVGKPLSLAETKEAQAAQEEFKKQAMMLAQQQFAAMGGTGTNDQLSSSIMTNPNEAISKYGLEGIIRTLQGNQDAINAKFQAFNKYAKTHGGPASYGDFLVEHGKDFEPRAYQLQHMSKEEGQKFLKNLSPNELKAVGRAWNFGQDNGYLTPGQGTSGQ